MPSKTIIFLSVVFALIYEKEAKSAFLCRIARIGDKFYASILRQSLFYNFCYTCWSKSDSIHFLLPS